MSAPTEYYVKYTYSSRSNTAMCRATELPSEQGVERGVFALTGNTDITPGLITRIVFRHWHTSTRKPSWGISARFYTTASAYIASDTQDVSFNNNAVCVTNTFTDNLPSDMSMVTAWHHISMVAETCDNSDATLYWRATQDEPMEVIIYFYDVRDLHVNCNPPTLNAPTFADIATPPGKSSTVYAFFGSRYVEGKSQPRITCSYQLDNVDFISATCTLVCKVGSRTVFSSTKTAEWEPTAAASISVTTTFDLSTIKYSGTLTATYTVRDNGGHAVSRSATATVLNYSAPALSGITVERYESKINAQGITYYQQADDGEYVRIALAAATSALNGKNAWSLQLTYAVDEDGGQTHTINNFLSGADGSVQTLSYNNTTVGNGQSLMSGYPIDPSKPWNFTFILADVFSSATGSGHVEEAGAYFNIERTGVSVGMRSQSSENDKRFEVAGDYGSYLYGGLAQVGDPINSLLALGLQFGSIAETPDVTYYSKLSEEIFFRRPYLSPPMVFLMPTQVNVTTTRIARCSVQVSEVTKDYFKVRYINDTSSTSVGVNWLALGDINPDPAAEPTVTVQRPSAPLTSNTGGTCTVTASSEWSSSYAAYRAFDNNLSTSWASASGESTSWIALHMDIALTAITVKVYSRDSQYVNNPLSGKVQGSVNGTTWVDIGMYSGWSDTARGTLLGTVECGNTTAYSHVRLTVSSHTTVGGAYAAIGNIKVSGVAAT